MAETIAESAILWYNICMSKHKYNQNHFNTIQLKIPVDLEKIIEISDPIYTFNEIMEQSDLYKYFAGKGSKTGRPRFADNQIIIASIFEYAFENINIIKIINRLVE